MLSSDRIQLWCMMNIDSTCSDLFTSVICCFSFSALSFLISDNPRWRSSWVSHDEYKGFVLFCYIPDMFSSHQFRTKFLSKFEWMKQRKEEETVDDTCIVYVWLSVLIYTLCPSLGVPHTVLTIRSDVSVFYTNKNAIPFQFMDIFLHSTKVILDLVIVSNERA